MLYKEEIQFRFKNMDLKINYIRSLRLIQSIIIKQNYERKNIQKKI